MRELIESQKSPTDIVSQLVEKDKTLFTLDKGDEVKAVKDFQQFNKGDVFKVLSYEKKETSIEMELEHKESKVDDVWEFEATGKGIEEFEEYFKII